MVIGIRLLHNLNYLYYLFTYTHIKLTKDKKNALNEIRILASIKHQNVIVYKEAFFDEEEGTLCIVMELADSGDF